MRDLVTAERVREFMRRIGSTVPGGVRGYLTGGATAVLLGWRKATADIDVRFEPEREEIFNAIPRLKEELRLNVEFASPPEFVPVPDGWRERSLPAGHEGGIEWFHFDPYGQVLAKIERDHEKDRRDVEEFFRRGLVDAGTLERHVSTIRSRLGRYPAIDEEDFIGRVNSWIGRFRK